MDTPPIGAGLSRDISTGERAEAELDSFIARRHATRVKSEGERDEEAAFRESERRARGVMDAHLRQKWARYHTEQAARHRHTLGALVDYHERRAERFEAAS